MFFYLCQFCTHAVSDHCALDKDRKAAVSCILCVVVCASIHSARVRITRRLIQLADALTLGAHIFDRQCYDLSLFHSVSPLSLYKIDFPIV